MDSALNNLQRLICHKTQLTNLVIHNVRTFSRQWNQLLILMYDSTHTQVVNSIQQTIIELEWKVLSYNTPYLVSSSSRFKIFKTRKTSCYSYPCVVEMNQVFLHQPTSNSLKLSSKKNTSPMFYSWLLLLENILSKVLFCFFPPIYLL